MEANQSKTIVERPTVLITNDDGIDAHGLRFLADALIASNLCHVLVCAPDRERSASSNSIIWQHPLQAKQVEIKGALAYAVTGTPADCASLGISGALFSGAKVDLVISGINLGSNVGSSIIYSGTVGGAREAFLKCVPSMSISCHWLGEKNSDEDLHLAAKICMPIVSAILKECRSRTYLTGSFLNIDLPGDLKHHKGYKITRQAKCIMTERWGKTSPDGTREESNDSAPDLEGSLWFKRVDVQSTPEHELREDEDIRALQEGYVTITPIRALSNVDSETRSYFTEWLHNLC